MASKLLTKTRAYVKCNDGQTRYIYFFIKDDDLLKKCNNIWDKVSTYIKKEFDSESVSNKILENQNNILLGWSYRFLC